MAGKRNFESFEMKYCSKFDRIELINPKWTRKFPDNFKNIVSNFYTAISPKLFEFGKLFIARSKEDSQGPFRHTGSRLCTKALHALCLFLHFSMLRIMLWSLWQNLDTSGINEIWKNRKATLSLFLNFWLLFVCCNGFVLLMVAMLGGLYIKIRSYRKGRIGSFLIPTLLLVILSHRLNSFSRYRSNICYRTRSVLCSRHLVFAIK